MSTILIADDNEDLRAMMRRLLESHGYRVPEAARGREAAEGAAGERPALVIMDSGMPEMDGLSAAAEIRRRVPAPEAEIIILCAYDRSEYRAEAVAAGRGGFITKPVEPAALLKSVRFPLRRGEGEASECG